MPNDAKAWDMYVRASRSVTPVLWQRIDFICEQIKELKSAQHGVEPTYESDPAPGKHCF